MKTPPKNLAVIGHPVAHSLSPLMQRAWMNEAGFEGEYEALDIATTELESFISTVHGGALDGFNVTLPHKQAVMDYLDELDESVCKTGAVNTIVRQEDGRLTGYNTDVTGINTALDEAVPGWQQSCRTILLIGAGGAARAALAVLSPLDISKITLANRTPARAEALARDMCPGATVMSLDALYSAPLEADLVINASSAGLAGQNPLAVNFSDKNKGVAFDCVYLPARTEFLKRAQIAGWHTQDGLAMLIHQGAAAFRHWWGRLPDNPVAVRQKLIAAMEQA